jgi:hypothetical protein
MTEQTDNSSSLKKEVDFLIRGGDLISMVFAMGLLRKRQEVLFYNEGPHEGECQNIHTWGDIEIRHLELLGEKIDSTALKDIRKHCRPVDYVYAITGKRLKLGSNPWKNLFNLYRRCPSWFDIAKSPHFDPRSLLEASYEEKFNREFERGLNRVAENCFRYRQLETLTSSLFETHMPEFFIHLAEALVHLFRNESIDSMKVYDMPFSERKFLLGLRFFYQHHLDLQWGKVEVYHLLLSILSPRYELDESSLMDLLQKEFCRFGGFWGDPEIFNALPFHDDKGHHLQTQNQHYQAKFCFSFINKMTLRDLPSKSSVLQFSNKESEQMVQLKTKLSMSECFSRHADSFKDQEWLYYCDSKQIGGDLAQWLIRPVQAEGIIELYTWVRYSECLDPQYFSSRALEVLKEMGVFKIGTHPAQIQFEKTGAIGHVHQFRNRALNFELHLPKRMPYVASTSPALKKNKDGIYLGKMRGSLMGSFGHILEVKDVAYWAEKTQ